MSQSPYCVIFVHNNSSELSVIHINISEISASTLFPSFLFREMNPTVSKLVKSRLVSFFRHFARFHWNSKLDDHVTLEYQRG